MSVIRIHTSETSAKRRLHELARENSNRRWAILHRVFGDAHRYVVGYYNGKNSRARFIAVS